MIVRFGLLKRRHDISVDQFVTYWREQHADVVKQHVRGLDAYVQNLVIDRSQKGIDYKRGSVEVDGLAQLHFASLAETRQMMDPAVLQALMDDEDNFLSGLTILTTLQNTVMKPPKSGHFIKRMSFLRKRSDISVETFQHEWFENHSFLVKRLPGLVGYRQNLVIDRFEDRFDPDGLADGQMIDGVVELWFENSGAIEQAFQSASGATTMMHAQEFISEISTYLVEVKEIIPEA